MRNDKIVSIQDIQQVVQSYKNDNLRIVQCSGVFNVAHYGHLEYFDFARQHGDILIVTINSDRALKQLRGENLHWISEDKRCKMLAALDVVDHVVVFDDVSAASAIRIVRPDVFVKGTDYQDKLPSDEVQALSECNCQVVFKNERSISASQLARSEGLLLRNYVERFNGLSLAVIGDFALDVYSYGTVARMSREAPVPVLIRDRNMPDDAVLGQAGNCALNIATLGATVFPIGVIGNDQTGSTIIDLLQQKGTSTEGLQVIDHFITPRKERIFAHNLNAPNQQIARIDDDQGAAKLTQLQQQQIIDSIDNILAKCDGVIFSDYGYGVCTSEIVNYVIQKCKQHNIIVLADSRYHIDLYRNVKAIMPSEAEVAPFLNQNITDDNIQQVVLSLRETLNVDHAVITRGSKGMMLTDGQGIYCFPGKSDVVDATGAGDTALALFALTLLSGASAYEAAKLSTAGVAISLMRKGTCVISRQELLAHLQVGLI